MDPAPKPDWQASIDVTAATEQVPADVHPGARLLNPVRTPIGKPWRDLAHIHDMRRARVNPDINEQVRVAIAKGLRFSNAWFTDEVIFHAQKTLQSQKRSWADGTFIHVSGNPEKAQASLEENEWAREALIKDMTRAPYHPGVGVFFHGIGPSRNYYHWMGEKFPRLALLEKFVDLDEVDHVFVGCDRELGFLRNSVELFFPELADRITYGSGYVACDECYSFASFLQMTDPNAHVDVPDGSDFHKASVQWGSLIHLAEKYDADPERYAEAPSTPAPVVVISRRNTVGRQLTNMDQLMERLAPLGAVEVFGEKLTIAQQIGLFRQARVVVGQHGAGMANLSFCREGGTTAIEIVHRRHARRTTDFIKLSCLRGLPHHVVIVDYDRDKEIDLLENPPERASGRYDGDLTACDDALDRIVTLVKDGLDRHPE